MAIKCLPIYLPPDLMKRLEERAQAEERDALQQARWMLRQALDERRQPKPKPAAVGTLADGR